MLTCYLQPHGNKLVFIYLTGKVRLSFYVRFVFSRVRLNSYICVCDWFWACYRCSELSRDGRPLLVIDAGANIGY
jgi:hypothetical protein